MTQAWSVCATHAARDLAYRAWIPGISIYNHPFIMFGPVLESTGQGPCRPSFNALHIRL